MERLVKENMSIAQSHVNGLTIPLAEIEKPMASVQAAWRFYNNDNVTIEALFAQLHTQNRQIVEEIESDYLLIAHDWSWLDYKGHRAKEALIVRNKRGNAKQIGYDLHTSLAIDPTTGHPLSPVAMNLQTKQAIHTSYQGDLEPSLTHLQELANRCKHLDRQFTTKRTVHIVDREGDSVAFMKNLAQANGRFLIRVRSHAKVHWKERGCEIKPKELAKALGLGQEVGYVTYHKKTARLYVNECEILITRKPTAKRSAQEEEITSEPLPARFVVSHVVNANNEILATWMLVTNVDANDADAATIGRWYYYRWHIESYFKLLKTTGFHLERWQQENPLALFRRLIVVAYAVVVVFKLAHTQSEEARKVRAFLTKLSGKLMAYGTEYTLPALLTGLWLFLRMMELLERYSLQELQALKEEAVRIVGPGWFGWEGVV